MQYLLTQAEREALVSARSLQSTQRALTITHHELAALIEAVHESGVEESIIARQQELLAGDEEYQAAKNRGDIATG